MIGHKSTLRSSKTWGAFLKHAEERNCLVPLKQLVGTVVSSSPRAGGGSGSGKQGRRR